MATGGINNSSRRWNGGTAAAGSESIARSSALQQLKNLHQQGGRRVDAFEIKIDDKIYDSVAEDDYAKLVAKRRMAVKDFVVDDASLRYNDDGEEDDWEAGDLPCSSSEEAEGDGGSGRRKKVVKDSSENRKKKDGGNPSKKASALSVAAASMGKQRVSSMFTSASMFRKNKEDKSGQMKGFSMDSILKDVLAEITPDEADREKRRRRVGSQHENLIPAIKELVAGKFLNARINIPWIARLSTFILANMEYEKGKTIVFTGHSMGGAIAALATLWMLEKLDTTLPSLE